MAHAQLHDDIEQIQQTSALTVERVSQHQVIDAPTYERAAELLKLIKGVRLQVSGAFDPIIARAHETHREAIARKKEQDEPLAQAETLLKSRMSGWREQQEQIRRVREAELAAEARLQDEERRLAEAQALEAAGEHQAAEQVLEEPSYVPPPVVASSVPKVAGIAAREQWQAEVVDLGALIQSVASGRAPRALLKVDTVVLGQLARAQKAELKIPGVKVWCKTGIAAGAR